MKLVLAAFLAGIAVGALLIVLEREPRGGVYLSNPWADSDVWRGQP